MQSLFHLFCAAFFVSGCLWALPESEQPCRGQELRDFARTSLPTPLLEQKQFAVYVGTWEQIEPLRAEMLQMRTEAFRAVGEGGDAVQHHHQLDTDRYDPFYHHLIVWDKIAQKVAASQRLGLWDNVPKRADGFPELYNFEFYDLKNLLRRLNQSEESGVDLGRTHVAPAYQGGSGPFGFLFAGLWQFLVQNPKYRYLAGSVSLSTQDYSAETIAVVFGGLAAERRLLDREKPMLAPGLPSFDMARARAAAQSAGINSAEALDAYLAKHTTLPLLKLYLKMGASFEGFADCEKSWGSHDALVVWDRKKLTAQNLRFLDRLSN